jgi:hypothetical protein
VPATIASINHLSKNPVFSSEKKQLEEIFINNMIPIYIKICNTKLWKPEELELLLNICNKWKNTRFPNIDYATSWFQIANTLLTKLTIISFLWDASPNKFVEFTKVLQKHRPLFFKKTEVKKKLDEVLDSLLSRGRGREDLDFASDGMDKDELDMFHNGYDRCVDLFEDLAQYARTDEEMEEIDSIASKYVTEREYVWEITPSEPDYEPEYEDYYGGDSPDSSVNDIFRDI